MNVRSPHAKELLNVIATAAKKLGGQEPGRQTLVVRRGNAAGRVTGVRGTDLASRIDVDERRIAESGAGAASRRPPGRRGRHLRAAPRRGPEHADAAHLLGLVRFRNNDVESAIRLIGEALARDPENPIYHANLGNVLKDSGDLPRRSKHIGARWRCAPAMRRFTTTWATRCRRARRSKKGSATIETRSP
jgi:hypothetical protein